MGHESSSVKTMDFTLKLMGIYTILEMIASASALVINMLLVPVNALNYDSLWPCTAKSVIFCD